MNAVEFQEAITQKAEGLQLLSKGKIDNGEEYYKWIYPYLFYLETRFDQRPDAPESHTINEKRVLMLVPTGAKQLKRVNFYNLDVDYCIYTNSLLDFYARPF